MDVWSAQRLQQEQQRKRKQPRTQHPDAANLGAGDGWQLPRMELMCHGEFFGCDSQKAYLHTNIFPAVCIIPQGPGLLNFSFFLSPELSYTQIFGGPGGLHQSGAPPRFIARANSVFPLSVFVARFLADIPCCCDQEFSIFASFRYQSICLLLRKSVGYETLF
jgi:hypothetical protein